MDLLKTKGIRALADKRNEKIGYKIREHSLSKVPLIFAIGEREVASRTVTIRRLGSKKTEDISLNDAISLIVKEAAPPDLT